MATIEERVQALEGQLMALENSISNIVTTADLGPYLKSADAQNMFASKDSCLSMDKAKEIFATKTQLADFESQVAANVASSSSAGAAGAAGAAGSGGEGASKPKPGVRIFSPGNWTDEIGADKECVTRGTTKLTNVGNTECTNNSNKSETTNGSSFFKTKGSTSTFVKGLSAEQVLGGKLAIIGPWKHETIIGAKTESIHGIHIKRSATKSVELNPIKDTKNLIDKFLANESFEAVLKMEQDLGQVQQDIKSQKSDIKYLKKKVGTLKEELGSANISVEGKYDLTADGDLHISGKGKRLLLGQGGDASLANGANHIKVKGGEIAMKASTVKINGTSLTVK